LAFIDKGDRCWYAQAKVMGGGIVCMMRVGKMKVCVKALPKIKYMPIQFLS